MLTTKIRVQGEADKPPEDLIYTCTVLENSVFFIKMCVFWKE